MIEELLRRIQQLQGVQDSRGPKGIFSRGANVYNGTSLAAHSGGGVQYGRPKKNAGPSREALARRLYGTNTS